MLYNQVQVICVFRHLDWKILHLNTELSLSKEEFLNKVFQRLNRSQINQLEKISICQFCDNEHEIYPFIQECCGQLWFDVDDIDNLRIKEFYLNSLNF